MTKLEHLMDWLRLHPAEVHGGLVSVMLLLLIWIFVDHYRNPNNRYH